MTHEKNRDFSFELKKIFFVFFDCGSWASHNQEARATDAVLESPQGMTHQ